MIDGSVWHYISCNEIKKNNCKKCHVDKHILQLFTLQEKIMCSKKMYEHTQHIYDYHSFPLASHALQRSDILLFMINGH